MSKNKRYSKAESRLLAALDGGVNSYDYADEAPQVLPGNNNLKLGKIPGNPTAAALFDMQILVKYFSVAAGVYTSRTAAYMLANAAALATQLGCFLFGNGDFAAGFKKAQSQFPLSGGWSYEAPFIYGRDYPFVSLGVLDATAKAQLSVGDLVIPHVGSSGGVDYVGFVILRCSSVAYATLLDSLSSDRFWINNIRYRLTDTTAAGLAQYNNSLFVIEQSLFGKFTSDSISPSSQIQPEQFQAGVVDVPIRKGVDKNVFIGSYVNYDSVVQNFSISISRLDKLSA